MIGHAMIRLAAVMLALVVAGCGPNWEAIQESQDRELQAHEAWTDNVAPLLSPPSGNAGEAAHVAYQVRLAYIGQTLEQMKPETMKTILAYAKSRDDRLYQALSLALNNPLTNALSQKWINGGNSGGNKFVFGGDDAENSFSNFDFTTGNQSPFVAGDDNQTGTGEASIAQDEASAASNDGQIISGEGNTQGQAVSRPNTQNDLDFAGDGGDSTEGDGGDGAAGDNTIDSEGLGFDGSL